MDGFRTIVDKRFLSLSARTTTGNSDARVLDDVHEGLVFVRVTSVSGTSPTLDVVVQVSDDGTNWYDHVDVPQITASGNFVQPTTNFGKFVRMEYTIGGTTPSFTFGITFVGKT